MSSDKEDKKIVLEGIVQELAKDISTSPDTSKLEEHLPYFHVKFGVVKGETDTYMLREVLVYPSIEIETSKAVSYSIRSNGLQINGRPLFYDSIKITGSNGKDVKIKGKYGDVVSFLERLYLALIILFKPEVIIKRTGLTESNPKYQAAMKALEEYNGMLEQVRKIKESDKELVDKKIEYFEVHGRDLLKRIEDYRMSG